MSHIAFVSVVCCRSEEDGVFSNSASSFFSSIKGTSNLVVQKCFPVDQDLLAWLAVQGGNIRRTNHENGAEYYPVDNTCVQIYLITYIFFIAVDHFQGRHPFKVVVMEIMIMQMEFR